ncbi:S24 family peptidase [Sphingomonas astaxanthinifaciens]|uniref:Peptidase S24/S26A/S26B/S26C domain-containing protein n=1 Tax=Sphingomonas astaxanthinifaciens DSM 22298 TaxID=1123267 RepID=A0ABQ5Z2S1_9SPHN|nr:S24 family peptidase [Sphingomonas astaxanthinifaciens]GLR46326.1 hypothetical protein GCM10007925_00370 [Sphingomonas astaxanthinifaciens DSM 22298]
MVDPNLPEHDPRETLRRLCAERGEDFASLSRLIGRNAAYIQQFIRRGTPRRLPERERRILAQHFGVSEQLLGAEPVAPAGEFVVPAMLGQAAQPGLAFAPAWLKRHFHAPARQLRLLAIEGDAMAPTLQAGDDVLVDLGDTAERLRDGLYALRVEGRLQVRRLTLHPVRAELTVQSDNPAHADWPGLSAAELDLIGRAVWSGRRLA